MAVNRFVWHVWGMAREDLHFRLRIPEDLKKRVEAFADLHNRSMTAEIIYRLQTSMDEETMSRVKDAEIEQLKSQVAYLRGMNASFANGIKVFSESLAKAEKGEPVSLKQVLKQIMDAEPPKSES